MQRLTREIGPASPEDLLFTADEARISVKALAYYTTASLRTAEYNWDSEGLLGLTQSAQDAQDSLKRLAQFVSFHEALAAKFMSVAGQPEVPTQLSPEEIDAVGISLYRLGVYGFGHAKKAVLSRRELSWGEKEATLREHHQTVRDAYGLFKALEPIAVTKPFVTWQPWHMDIKDERQPRLV